MRRLALILVALGPVAGEEVLLHEPRAWKGFVDVTSVSLEPPVGEGRERQRERIEFVLLTRPPRKSVGTARLPLTMREGSGAYELSIDTREGEAEAKLVTKGRGTDRLHPNVAGWVQPADGRYRLAVAVTPSRLIAKTTLSGMARGRFQTWRTVLARASFLGRFDVEGETTEGGRVIAGERVFEDRRARLKRDVEIRWRIERVDPVVKGRVVDHLGGPVAGLEVIARSTNAVRLRKRLPPLLRTGKTDADGRFAVDVFWAHWRVEIKGAARDGVVYAGRPLEGGVDVRFDDVPAPTVEIEAYHLAKLPWSYRLARAFEGDVDQYLAYVRERASDRRLRQALVAPPAER